ncbi:MAG: alpha/beta fold hydrolase [Thermomonas sp.]|uniref:YheT family hydrolase n=1 Tax=Thermomonas sp. TaxID=1971895 RepID=UPI0039E39453
MSGTGPQRSPFAPPAWLRSPHLQSVLSSSPLRARRAHQRLHAVDARHEPMLVDAGDGVRLQGVYSTPVTGQPHALVLLLHGWEGSVDSSYMRLTAASLLRAGFAVFRLNFRDHGDSHHLNEGLFHSNRIDEIVRAACEVSARWPCLPLHAAGYSLGGNFALRLALRAPAAGLPLQRVAAVCPVLDPARTMEQMENGLPLYMRYFEHKWRRSLARKRELFPQAHGFADDVLKLRMRALTEWMVLRHTDFATLDDYFDGYSVAGERLRALALPADILMAADDPVIPLREFERVADYPQVQLELAAHGGHCGFIESASLDGYAERWVTERLLRHNV